MARSFSKFNLISGKALAKAPDQRFSTCTEFINALAAACNANPGWTPLPRGVSSNMPTAGSGDDLSATVADTRPPAPPVSSGDNDATRFMPPPPPARDPVTVPVSIPARVPEIEPERGHTLRNVFLSIAAVAVLATVIFMATRKPATQPESPPVASVSPAPPVEAAPVGTRPAPVQLPAQAAEEPKKVAAAPLPDSSPPKESPFQLTTSPPGATAVFDSSGVECITPCNLSLPAGRHTFLLRHAGYRDAQKIINTPDDTGLIVDLVAMTGTLNLITNPAGLTVVVDGREHAQKTPVSLILPVGPHKVQVVKGNERQDIQVDLSDGQFVSKTISWQ